MTQALSAAIIVFALCFVGLSVLELLIHRITKNKSKAYRWGVWVFSGLLAMYAFVTTLGR